MTDSEPMPTASGSRPVQQPLLEGIDTNTGPMWAIALLPLAGILSGFIPAPAVPLGSTSDPGTVVLQVVSIVVTLALTAAEVLLAHADRRILIERGLIRPMHWGWAFLDLVYVIGRFVVVRRRVRGSLRPLAVYGVAFALEIVINNLPH